MTTPPTIGAWAWTQTARDQAAGTTEWARGRIQVVLSRVVVNDMPHSVLRIKSSKYITVQSAHSVLKAFGLDISLEPVVSRSGWVYTFQEDAI